MLTDRTKNARIIALMGVTGCGKTTVGSALAQHDKIPFLDGDDFHPPANIAKMASGTPLTDEDRWPWLDLLGKALAQAAETNGRVYTACSALRRVYRDHLIHTSGEKILFLHLAGPQELIEARIAQRTGHYMPPELLDSQFATLELPREDENAVRISIDGTPDFVLSECQRIIGPPHDGH